MSKNITPYKDSELGKKQQVEQMFDNISGGYDTLNRIISLGSDMRWKKKIVRLIDKKNPFLILDVATGTGDLAIMLSRTKAAEIIGVDISEGMLKMGRKKLMTRLFQKKSHSFRQIQKTFRLKIIILTQLRLLTEYEILKISKKVFQRCSEY